MDNTMIDDRIRIRKGKQTVRITVTITSEQHSKLKSLAEVNGFNISELVRYALVQLFRQPCMSLSSEDTNDKQNAPGGEERNG